MSNFICEYCGASIIDSDHGYVTGCEHYPMERPAWDRNLAALVNAFDVAMRGESYLEWREGVLDEMADELRLSQAFRQMIASPESFHYCDESFFQLLVRSIIRCGKGD